MSSYEMSLTRKKTKRKTKVTILTIMKEKMTGTQNKPDIHHAQLAKSKGK